MKKIIGFAVVLVLILVGCAKIREDLPDNLTDVNQVFKIESSVSGGHGSIYPEGEFAVNKGDSLLLTFTPDSGYEVSEVTVNGENIGNDTSYTLLSVKEDNTIVYHLKLLL